MLMEFQKFLINSTMEITIKGMTMTKISFNKFNSN